MCAEQSVSSILVFLLCLCVLQTIDGGISDTEPGYYYATIVLLAISITMQVVVGLLYIVVAHSKGRAKKMTKHKLYQPGASKGSLYGTFDDNIDGHIPGIVLY